jgi:hypothetical protein
MYSLGPPKDYFHEKKESYPFNANKNSYSKTVRSILSFQGKERLMGSYARYGKEKSCDCDIIEEVDIEPNTFWDQWTHYFQRLQHHTITNPSFQLLEIDLKMNHPDIQSILSKLGYINGLYQIVHFQWNDSDLLSYNYLTPSEKHNILSWIHLYTNEPTLYNYMEMYTNIRSMQRSSWTFEEVLNGKKKQGNYIFDWKQIVNYPDYITIECLYENYRVSISIYLLKQGQKKKTMGEKETIDFGIKYLIKNDFYHILKKFAIFLKWLYYNKQHTKQNLIIHTFNRIYQFREYVNPLYIQLCKKSIDYLSSGMSMIQVEQQLEQDMYSFQMMCSTLYNELSSLFQEDLIQYIRYT